MSVLRCCLEWLYYRANIPNALFVDVATWLAICGMGASRYRIQAILCACPKRRRPRSPDARRAEKGSLWDFVSIWSLVRLDVVDISLYSAPRRINPDVMMLQASVSVTMPLALRMVVLRCCIGWYVAGHILPNCVCRCINMDTDRWPWRFVNLDMHCSLRFSTAFKDLRPTHACGAGRPSPF